MGGPRPTTVSATCEQRTRPLRGAQPDPRCAVCVHPERISGGRGRRRFGRGVRLRTSTVTCRAPSALPPAVPPQRRRQPSLASQCYLETGTRSSDRAARCTPDPSRTGRCDTGPWRFMAGRGRSWPMSAGRPPACRRHLWRAGATFWTVRGAGLCTRPRPAGQVQRRHGPERHPGIDRVAPRPGRLPCCGTRDRLRHPGPAAPRLPWARPGAKAALAICCNGSAKVCGQTVRPTARPSKASPRAMVARSRCRKARPVVPNPPLALAHPSPLTRSSPTVAFQAPFLKVHKLWGYPSANPVMKTEGLLWLSRNFPP